MMEILDRSSFTGIFEISTSSMYIFPHSGLTRRNKTVLSEVFPESRERKIHQFNSLQLFNSIHLFLNFCFFLTTNTFKKHNCKYIHGYKNYNNIDLYTRVPWFLNNRLNYLNALKSYNIYIYSDIFHNL